MVCYTALEELRLPELSFLSASGIIKTPEKEIPISGIFASLSENGDVVIEGKISAGHLEINNFDIEFQDRNGWKVTGKKFSIFQESGAFVAGAVSGPHFVAFKAKGWKLIADRGEISNDDEVNIYYIITDIKFASERRIPGFIEPGIKFSLDKLNNLVLIRSEALHVPLSVGYFAVSDEFSNYGRKWENYLDILQLMFRFAATDFINLPVLYIKNRNGGEHLEITAYIEYGGRGSKIFYLSYPGSISDFVNSTFDQFILMREKLDLDKLIMYYIMMRNTGFVDNSYLLGCIFIEGLKYSFAKNIKNYGYDNTKHKFIRSTGVSYNFRELLQELYDEYHIRHGSTSFIRYRNEVVHEGKISSISFDDILREKMELQITIDHLLLKILKYNGLYWDRPSREWVDYSSITT
ncbi:Uncharacterised protein [uncultured archaeon]|nr:Uncharacterised protein [uncultured archaeon]